MKNVLEILSGLGIEVPEDKREELNKGVTENYRTINDYNLQVQKTTDETTRADGLQKQYDEVSGKLKDLEGSEGDKETIETLNKKIKEFEDAETARKEAEAQAAKEKALSDGFDAAIKEKGELIPFTREGLFAEAKKLMEDDELLGIDKAVEKVIEGKDGIFVNPQNTPHKQPIPGSSDVPPDLTVDQIKEWSPDKINENWDAVQKVLEAQK